MTRAHTDIGYNLGWQDIRMILERMNLSLSSNFCQKCKRCQGNDACRFNIRFHLRICLHSVTLDRACDWENYERTGKAQEL